MKYWESWALIGAVVAVGDAFMMGRAFPVGLTPAEAVAGLGGMAAGGAIGFGLIAWVIGSIGGLLRRRKA